MRKRKMFSPNFVYRLLSPVILLFLLIFPKEIEPYASNYPNEEANSTLRQVLQANRIDKWALWGALVAGQRGSAKVNKNSSYFFTEEPLRDVAKSDNFQISDLLMGDSPAFEELDKPDGPAREERESKGDKINMGLTEQKHSRFLEDIDSSAEALEMNLKTSLKDFSPNTDLSPCVRPDTIADTFTNAVESGITCADALGNEVDPEETTNSLLSESDITHHSETVMDDATYGIDELGNVADERLPVVLGSEGAASAQLINDVGRELSTDGTIFDDPNKSDGTYRPLSQELLYVDEDEGNFDDLISDDSYGDSAFASSERYSVDVQYIGDREFQDEPANATGASLAFIFDSTGSMQDELNQVKVGAAQILSSLLANEEVVIHNFILVPFNDPDIGPVTVTTNHTVFQERIADISVHGGGDCVEMSIGGLKKALSVARNNSFFYIFTDASAKDYHLQEEVLGLIQQLQAQVVVIMTDSCDDENTEHYQVYERLAAASSGQVYHLSKSEVGEVLKYVKVSLRQSKVNLLSQNRPAPAANTPDNHVLLVDETIKEFTVSVSGRNASISVEDPKGVKRDDSPSVEPLLTLQNVKIVNVKEPDPGQWQVLVNSESDYSVRASGTSEVRFNHGFSATPTTNIAETYHRPLQGASCYLLIQASDTATVHNLTEVDLVGLSGSVLQRLPLVPVPGVPGLFSASNFTPPTEFFHLGISGVGKDGYPIKRITTTAISPSLPEKPRLALRQKIIGRAHEPISIGCFVTSLVPFSVQWYKEGRALGNPAVYPQTRQVEYKIEKLVETSEGNYTCHVKNVAGVEWKTTYLAVTGHRPIVNATPRITATVDSLVELPCTVKSELQVTVRWTQMTTRNKYSGIVHPVLRGKVYANHSLILPSVTVDDEGYYICTAENKAGDANERTYLSIHDPVSVSVSPTNVTFAQGESVRLTCTGKGRPQPKLEWRRDHVAITKNDAMAYVEEANGLLYLVLEFMDKERAGLYSCVAVNSDEPATAHVELWYKEKPEVKASANSVMVKVGAESSLSCVATGAPEPVIVWKRSGHDLTNNPRYRINLNKLTIANTQPSDAGEFSCIARNEWGEAFDYIGLFVGSPPSFLQRPRDRKIQVFHNGTIFCAVTGSPPPDISWQMVGGSLDASRMFILPSGGLRITHAQVTDARRYLCLAHNIFGNISAEIMVSITGTEKPAPDRSGNLAEVKVLAGGGASLPCGISLGNPQGSVTWLRNGTVIPGTHSIGGDGRLELPDVTAEVGGQYECIVTNDVGNASRTIQLSVLESPKVSGGYRKKDVISKIGGKSILECPIAGNPKPNITWYKNGAPVNFTYYTYQNTDGNFVFDNVAEENAGSYVCTATNELGSTSFPVFFSVYVPPTLPKGRELPETPHEVVEGHMVVLNCETHAVPTPNVVWYKDGAQLSSDDERIITSAHASNQIIRFVATVDDTGEYKCIVSNEVGTATKEFRVNILVPPRITDPGEEPLHARAGQSITLLCNVTGVPTPEVLWRRHGTYLTTNTTELTLLGPVLQLSVVTAEAAGAYVCDAENSAGITQQTFYLKVTFPPQIVEQHVSSNFSVEVIVREGDEFSQSCHVEGNPKPRITWYKNHQPLHPYQPGLIILGDDTLLIVQTRGEHAGIYTCRAENDEGSAEKEFRLDVATVPTLSGEIPLRMEVNEGEKLVLTCPTTGKPPPNIRWMKNGLPFLTLIDRGDEAPMKLSSDRRELRLAEAHPADSGNYSCVATNAAGRTDATFMVIVLMTPHFEEFNHLARRTVLVGGSVALNCSVSGNPDPQVSWRKDLVAVTAGSPAGVVVSRDHQHLVIPSAKPHHSGTYTCSAANKVNAREREFYVTVLEPPNIEGPASESKEVLKGEKLELECTSTGSPAPTISWFAEDCDGIKYPLNISSNLLELENVDMSHSTLISCEATNSAGSRVKHFNVTVLEIPYIEGQEETDEVEVPSGGNVSLRCLVRGQPRPEVTWLHNGRLVNNVVPRARRSVPTVRVGKDDDMMASLLLSAVGQQEQGLYTVIASNRAGYSEKHFRVNVAVPPEVTGPGPYLVSAVKSSTALLECPVKATPPPEITWALPSAGTDRLIDRGRQLAVHNVTVDDSGLYNCTARNPAGLLNVTVQLDVLEPPWISSNTTSQMQAIVRDNVTLYCLANGYPKPFITWLRNSKILFSTSEPILELINVSLADAGTYSCVATNVAGAAEKSFQLQILEPPVLNIEPQQSLATQQNVSLHRRLKLSCPFSGQPQPQIKWFKDVSEVFVLQNDEPIFGDSNEQIVSQGLHLIILRAEAEHVGEYRCSAENPAGERSLIFQVSVSVSASWTAWSQWSNCSATCGEGLQFRERTCSFGSGSPHNQLSVDKSQCSGDDREQRMCFNICEVDGGWGGWSEWAKCSSTCGPSTRQRHRVCDSPMPTEGGQPCTGPSIEEEDCSLDPCPSVWSDWSEWSECSRSCGGGQRKKSRTCLGEHCQGMDYQLEHCNEQKCKLGRWLPWGDWGRCSATCGKGFRKRTRHCKPAYTRSKPCKDKIQLEPCYRHPCPSLVPPPSTALVHLKGSLNNVPVDSKVFANMSEAHVSAQVLTNEVNWFPYAPILLSPLTWSAAAEEDSANNVYSLTSGHFSSLSNVTFDSGEAMGMRAEGQGLGEDGALTVVIEVTGEAPFFESAAAVQIKSLEQDFIQVSEDTLATVTEDVMMMNDQQVTFAMNSSLRYDSSRGTMPYYVEKLSISDIRNDYHPTNNMLQFTASAKIGKKFENNHCPPGFEHDERHLHCTDVDECLTSPCAAGHACQNSWGSFLCSDCLPGYTKSGSSCMDVNECEQDRCQHHCINTNGSFVCSCWAGSVLSTDGTSCLGSDEAEKEDSEATENDSNSSSDLFSNISEVPVISHRTKTYSYQPSPANSDCPPGFQRGNETSTNINTRCTDIDECRLEPDPCGSDAFCLNVVGSFQCLDISCPPSFSRELPSTTCTAECNRSLCRHGAEIAESIIFAVLPLNSRDFVPFADVLQLQVQEHDLVFRRQARVLEGHALRLRTTKEHTTLYAPATLKQDTLYKVTAEVQSFGLQGRLLYSTEFIVYLILI